ncbi:MAG TPA: hypothetical protein VK772_14100 [Puia sp.]|nr:hypothetical protein [Puia sp.]
MKLTLTEIMDRLDEDRSLVSELYEQVFASTYYTLAKPGTENSGDNIAILVYHAFDNVQELPLFTDTALITPEFLKGNVICKVGGRELWVKFLQFVETGKKEIAINPSQVKCIRINRESLLGMISLYGGGLEGLKIK